MTHTSHRPKIIIKKYYWNLIEAVIHHMCEHQYSAEASFQNLLLAVLKYQGNTLQQAVKVKIWPMCSVRIHFLLLHVLSY